jgi:Gas vesicle protein
VPRRTPANRQPTDAERVLDPPQETLLDVLDHLLDKGVVATGDVTLGVAGVDLIYLRLSALLCAVDLIMPAQPVRRRQRTRKPRLAGRGR